MIPALAGVASRLAPYSLWLKLGVLVLALLAGGWVGWRLAQAGNAAELRALDAKVARLEQLLVKKNAALSNAAAAFRAISAQTRKQREAAEAAIEANEEAAKRAEREYEALLDRLSGFDALLRDAKRRGGQRCADQLEAPLCVPLE